MTSRQVFDYVLLELNKRKAPSLLLEDFIYFANKAIQQYENIKYNAYEMNQQSIDDLAVLRATAILTPAISSEFSASDLLSKVYKVALPDDYLHLLNCVVEYTVQSNYKCYVKDELVQFGAIKMTSNSFPQLIKNYYFKPSFDNPYYFINNVNVSNVYPTSDGKVNIVTGTPPAPPVNTEGVRTGNKSKVRMEIRYGKDNSKFKPTKIYVDYLKTPQFVNLTQDEIEDPETDPSQILEFPEYVCQEIVNLIVKLVMENVSDPRIQSNNAINQTIPIPGAKQ